MPLRVYGAVVTGQLVQDKNPNVDALEGLDNARERVEILEKAIIEAHAAIKAHESKNPPPQGSGTQRVFLAPEYYFSSHRWKNDRFFNKALKWWILANLKRIARDHDDMLILPGTLLWTEEALQSPTKVMERELKGGASSKEAFKKAVLMIELKNRPQFAAMSRALVPGNKDAYEAQYTDSVEPMRNKGIVEVRENALPGKVGQKVKVLDPLTFMGPKAQPTKLAYNTAYVCYGSKVLEYHKTGNFQEVKGEKDSLIYFSGGVQGIFTLGGIRYGLEICRDHATGVLKNPVDIHLITSSFVDFIKSSALLVLHSSTQAPGIIHYSDGSTHDAKTNPLLAMKGKVNGAGQLKLKDSTVHIVDIPSLNPGGGGLEGIGMDQPVAWWA